MNFQDLQPGLAIRNADFDFAIEAAGTPKGRVQHLRDVCRTYHDDLAARDKTIHQAQELRHHPLFNFAGNLRAFRSHGVNLVDKKNRRRMPRRFLENLAELGFTLAVKFPHDLRAVQVNEMNAAFGCHRASQQRLARARRAVQEHAFRRENPQLLEDARILQRQLDDFAHARYFAFQAADVFVRHRRRARRCLLSLHDA